MTADSQPWNSPTPKARPSPANSEAATDQPCVYCSQAISTPTAPSSEPTARSIWRATMMSAMPLATMPTTAVCCAML